MHDYQFKRSTQALGYGKRGLDGTQAWVKKAMKDLDTEDYARIRYALPEGASVPPQITKWFEEVLEGAIEIVRIPHIN